MLPNVLALLDPFFCKVLSYLTHTFSLHTDPFLDFHHIDLLAHFDRERIPERVVSSLMTSQRFQSN